MARLQMARLQMTRPNDKAAPVRVPAAAPCARGTRPARAMRASSGSPVMRERSQSKGEGFAGGLAVAGFLVSQQRSLKAVAGVLRFGAEPRSFSIMRKSSHNGKSSCGPALALGRKRVVKAADPASDRGK